LLDFALFFLGAVELVLVLFVLGFKSTRLPFELLDLVLLLIVRIDAIFGDTSEIFDIMFEALN